VPNGQGQAGTPPPEPTIRPPTWREWMSDKSRDIEDALTSFPPVAAARKFLGSPAGQVAMAASPFLPGGEVPGPAGKWTPGEYEQLAGSGGLDLSAGARAARARQQGFSPGPLYVRHASPANEPLLYARGFDLSQRTDRPYDLDVPTAIFLRSAASTAPSGGQVPIVSRATGMRNFADRPGLQDFLRQDPVYNRAYSEFRARYDPMQSRIQAARDIARDPARSPQEQTRAAGEYDRLLQEQRQWVEAHMPYVKDLARESLLDRGVEGGTFNEKGLLPYTKVKTAFFLRPEQLRSPYAAFNPARMGGGGLLLQLAAALGLDKMVGGADRKDVAAPPPKR